MKPSPQKRKPASPLPATAAKPPPGLKPPAGAPASPSPGFVKPKLPDERDAPAAKDAAKGAGKHAQPKKDAKDDQAKQDAPAKPRSTGPVAVGPVIPPAVVPLPLPEPPTVLKLGPGIVLNGSTPTCVQAGILYRSTGMEKAKGGKVPTERWHIERVATRAYKPSVGDPVVLMVLARAPYGAEAYLCSYAPLAPPLLLPYLAFENATKRNKPELKPGDLVYARVTRIGAGEGEVECLGPSGRAEGFGELKGGTVAKIPAGICRKMLAPSHPLLPSLGQHMTFDVAIGLNGQLWITSPSVSDTLCAIDCIKELGVLSGTQEEFAKRVGAFVRNWRAARGPGKGPQPMDVDSGRAARRDDSDESEEDEGDMELDG
ncbi:hypothetical protein DFJ74DRAFT_621378 [Hyaloraphidium curvatum]|nr:hypothetical protein DFJ74DRAFT_621378 [Hyaloraphidium curvatum]